MKISIIGAGAIGSAIARKLALNNINATISNSRGPDSLRDLVLEFGPHINAVGLDDACSADVVIVAIQWERLAAVLEGMKPWNGRILVDANNAVEIPSFSAVDLGGRTSSRAVAEWAPGARVVKAFNHLAAHLLDADPQTEGGRRVLFISGEDADAKSTISDLAKRLGFAAVDLGGESEGRLAQFPGGPLAICNFVKFE